MKILKPILQTTIRTIALSILILIFYIFIAFGFTLFPNQKTNMKKSKKQTIYILYSSMHSDIVIDLEKSKLPWRDYLPNLLKSKKRGFISFGWGDQETYLNTPTWDDLKLSTALKALFINTPSLMHVTYIRDIHRFRYIKEVNITQEQHSKLEENILSGFGEKIEFYSKGYRYNDKFYYSKSRQYNIINTCNTWTGETLLDANISVSRWTPFAYNVINSLP